MSNNTVGFVGFGEAASIFAFDIRKEIDTYAYDKISSVRIFLCSDFSFDINFTLLLLEPSLGVVYCGRTIEKCSSLF